MSDKLDTAQEVQAQLREDLRREQELRSRGYRERALKLFPWICARCGREFSGKKLRELTVHHKDHNHDYNPPDGSNWELLCLYCHEQEHIKLSQAGQEGPAAPGQRPRPASTFQPFADLDKLLR